MRLRILLLILGGKINKEKEKIVYTDADSKPKNARELKDIYKNRKAFDFNFSSSQKRRLDEYDDLFAYISNKQTYLYNKDDPLNRKIEEIDFGVINRDKLNPDNRTSSNVWISVLDKNLNNMTSKKLDMAYFENQQFYVWMDLNKKFFFDTISFERFEDENFPDLNKDDVLVALDQIVMSCQNTKKKGVDNFFFFFNLNHFLGTFDRRNKFENGFRFLLFPELLLGPKKSLRRR